MVSNRRARGARPAVLLLVAAACLAAWAGPRTTVAEFFGKHLNTKIPALSGIPAKMQAGDVAGAEKIFADHVRSALKPEVLNRDWLGYRHPDSDAMKRVPPAAEKQRIEKGVKETMGYYLSSCGMPHQFPMGKIDWHANPTFNKYCEWTWQLSRHPFWTNLAQYYTYSQDEKAAKVWVDQISSWFDQAICPEKASSYATLCWRTIEAGIRMDGWSRQIHAFVKSPSLSDEFITRYFISIWEHGWRLRNNSTSGNWLLMELHGLLRITLLYPFLNDASEWNAYALKRLEAEFSRQVYPDGFQYELATGYHGVVVYNYLSVYNLYQTLGMEKPEFIRKGLENMFTLYARLSRPDRFTPSLNDGAHDNVVANLRTAAKLYPAREDFRWFATEGKEGREPDYLSHVLPWAGAVVFRSSWAKDAVWGYLDGSPFGRGHQHEDKLNFLLHAYGKTMLTEGGNYMYDSSDCRRYVLSTRSHNTIRIDGLDQNRRSTYHWADADIHKKAEVSFVAQTGKEVASSTYNEGYGPKRTKFTHSRKVLFIQNEKGLAPFFVIVDRLTAPDQLEHTFEQMWHLEECALKIQGTAFTGDFGKGTALFVATSDGEASIKDMKGQHAPYYQGWMPIWKGGPHEHRPIPTPVACGSFKGAKRIVTVLYPYKDGAKKISGVKASSSPTAETFVLYLSNGTTRCLSED